MVRRYLAALLLLATPALAAVELDGDSNGAIDVAKGGTNATTAAGARTALGVPATAATLVGDCTVGPCLDGSADGGNLIKLWAGTGSYWTALQGGNPAANRSWRLPIAAAPTAGETLVMTMDEYGQMGFLAAPETSGYVLSSTDAGVLSWAAGGSGTGIAHATADGKWYGSKDGAWVDLAPTFSSALPRWIDLATGHSFSVGDLTWYDAKVWEAKTNHVKVSGNYPVALSSDWQPYAAEITLDASLTETGGVLSVTNPVTDYDTDGDGDFTDEAWFPVGTGGYLATPPTYSDEACTPGQYALSESYRWDCVATGNWNRTALTDWSNPTPVPPTLTSATVGTAGLYADLLFSETVKAGTGGNGGWSMSCATTGAISMTYSSGDTTNTLAYSLSDTPIQGETCTVAYTQPTDGIEAVDDGADLATIASAAVTNNSEVAGAGGPFLQDTFTEASATTLVSHSPDIGGAWSYTGTAGGVFSVGAGTGRVVNTTNLGNIAKNAASPPSADYSVTVAFKIDNAQYTRLYGGCVRIQSDKSAYCAYLQGDGTFVLSRYKSDSAIFGTTLASDTNSITLGHEYTLSISISGTSISAVVDGLSTLSATDATITSPGSAGIILNYVDTGGMTNVIAE